MIPDPFPRPVPGVWPPDYVGVFAWRMRQLERMRVNPIVHHGMLEFYRTNAFEFIEHWMTTYDPRNAEVGPDGKLTFMPFVLFDRQKDLVEFIYACLGAQSNGLIEKCRDMGATWLLCAISVHLWRFLNGAAVGWGSRKQELVDELGIADSIMEKIRIIIRNLPREFWPIGFDPSRHMPFMRIINPANGATITGEVGDNIGRGGRKLIYFKDEAQPLSAGILTPFGWRTMADMRIGSQVIGADGKSHSVTHINDAGVHPVYRLTMSDGTSVECSPNHLWTVDQIWGKRERKTLRTWEIADRYRYDSPGGQMQYRYRLPVTAPVEFSDDEPLPLHPYVVGALLGDGSIATVPENRPKFTTADPEIAEQVARHLPQTVLLVKGDRYDYRLNDVQGRRGRFKISRASQAIVDAGIAGKNSWEKFIPDRYKFASVSDRLALLQGLMDTDGSASGGVASYHTTSARLADDVRFLVQSLGGTATLNVKPDARGYRDIYVLHLALGMPVFRLSRKLEKLKSRKHSIGRTITGVELLPSRPVRCITVDVSDGLYLTDHCIVTHNSAHYERPDLIEASLLATTRVQIDISSVNGLGNVFHRKREAGVDWSRGAEIVKGKTNVFVMAWSDHPEKTPAWYEQERVNKEEQGLAHIFAQEVERNYAASLTGVVIKAEWISAAIDADKKLKFDDEGPSIAGLDVADDRPEGDLNAVLFRKGPCVKDADEWGGLDTTKTTQKAVSASKFHLPCRMQYDSIGIGAGVKGEANRLAAIGELPDGLLLYSWAASAKVLFPEGRVIKNEPKSPLNKDFFANLKAQAWWELARRFERTWKAVIHGVKYDPGELISIPSTLRLLRKLEKELAQVTYSTDTQSAKVVINKTPKGTKSPNIADACVMAFWPVGSTLDLYTKQSIG